MDIHQLEHKAKGIRLATLDMIAKAKKGHIGGSFSAADILVALYYGGILRFDSKNPEWDDRDRFILSKGHSCESFYAVLADLGFFPVAELQRYQQPGCCLGGHPSRAIPGVEAETGSLGHGLGIGCGLALSAKMDQREFLTCVLMGDGECCEGSVWEAAMFAVKRQLGRLVAIIDNNGLCVTDVLKDCSAVEPLAEKWQAFGWDVEEVDGHDFASLLEVLAPVRGRRSDRPLALVARTVKGKGVSFMENKTPWHHGVPKAEQVDQARRELAI